MEGITTQSQCKVLLTVIFHLFLMLIEKSLLYCKIRVAAIKSLVLSYTWRTKLSQEDKTSYQEINRLGGFAGSTAEPVLKDKSHRGKSYNTGQDMKGCPQRKKFFFIIKNTHYKCEYMSGLYSHFTER